MWFDFGVMVPISTLQVLGEIHNISSVVNASLFIAISVQLDVMKHIHKFEPVWECSLRRVALRVCDELCNPAYQSGSICRVNLPFELYRCVVIQSFWVRDRIFGCPLYPVLHVCEGSLVFVNVARVRQFTNV